MLSQHSDRSHALEEIESAIRLVLDSCLARRGRNPDSARDFGRAPRVDQERVQVLDRHDELRPDLQARMNCCLVKACHDLLEREADRLRAWLDRRRGYSSERIRSEERLAEPLANLRQALAARKRRIQGDWGRLVNRRGWVLERFSNVALSNRCDRRRGVCPEGTRNRGTVQNIECTGSPDLAVRVRHSVLWTVRHRAAAEI